MHELSSFGVWLRRRRRALDLTQHDLASRVGVAYSTVRKWEADERRPSLDLAERLAELLALPPAERDCFILVARGERAVEHLAALSSVLEAQPPRPGPSPRSSLPVQRLPLLNRERERAALRRLLLREDVGLVTVTGPGGVGKTRLALHVAAGLQDAFPDGVVLVELASIRDPHLVPATIAHRLGLAETARQTSAKSLAAYLRGKRLLLVLDNLEQVLDAAPFLAELLAAAPGLTLLVTSRAVLHLSDEHVYPVAPLEVPMAADGASMEVLRHNPAVALFVQRAEAVKADFQLTPATAVAVAEICRRLEGLPLAIELAAARVPLLPPAALLAQLSTPLRVLTGGAHDRPARQQMLRRTLDWSYELLTPEEQTLFRRLGVFVGGCTLEAVEAVCTATGDLPDDLLAGLGSLVDKSLLLPPEAVDEEPRFTMLETLREYAWEQLADCGEAPALRSAHAAYYLALVEAAAPELTGAQQATWLARLELEHANLRAALTWLLEQAEEHAADLAARLCRALLLFWIAHNHLAEGRHWCAAALTAPVCPSPALRAHLLIASGQLAREHGDLAQAQVLLVEGLAGAREVGDRRAVGDALAYLQHLALQQGNYTQATRAFEENRRVLQETGNTIRLARVVMSQAWAVYAQGDLRQTVALLEESLALFQELGDQRNVNYAICSLACMDVLRGDAAIARTRFMESLDSFRRLGDQHGVASALEGLVFVYGALQQASTAGRLAGAGAALRETIDVPMPPMLRADYEHTLANVRAQLGDAAFRAAWAEGRVMTVEQAIAYAVEPDTLIA